MPFQPSVDLKPIVPHYLLPERPIDQALLDHFDTMITHHQGFMVVDYTGALIRQMCHQIPKLRAKDTAILSFRGAEKVLGSNPLIPSENRSAKAQAAEVTGLLATTVAGGLTPAEAKLVQHSCQALLHIGEISRDPSFFCNMISLVKLWHSADFRRWADTYLWDMELKAFWREFDKADYAKSLTSLQQKLAWLFTNPMGLAELYHTQALNFAAVMEGRMFLLDASLPSLHPKVQKLPGFAEKARYWQQFRTDTLVQQYGQALNNEALAERLLFVNASNVVAADLRPTNSNPWPKFQEVVTKYSDMRYKRRREFDEVEMASVLKGHVSCFENVFGRDFELPAITKDKISDLYKTSTI